MNTNHPESDIFMDLSGQPHANVSSKSQSKINMNFLHERSNLKNIILGAVKNEAPTTSSNIASDEKNADMKNTARSTSADFFIGNTELEQLTSHMIEDPKMSMISNKQAKRIFAKAQNKGKPPKVIPVLSNKAPPKVKPVLPKAPFFVKENEKAIAAMPEKQNVQMQKTLFIKGYNPNAISGRFKNPLEKLDIYPAMKYPSGIPLSFLANNIYEAYVPPVQVETQIQNQIVNTYSPTEALGSGHHVEDDIELEDLEAAQLSESTDVLDESQEDVLDEGQERVSAFQRLGPISQPKRPKLTINLLFSKDQPVREVVDLTNDEKEVDTIYVPVHKRREVLLSIDELVIKYLPLWPWKKPIATQAMAIPRPTKEAMLQDLKIMSEHYAKPDVWIKVVVKGYPHHFTKEQLFDVLYENVKNNIFIPCFIEFKPDECMFLLLKSQKALMALHNIGLVCRTDDLILPIMLAYSIKMKLNSLDFHPKLILARRLILCYDGNNKSLNLSGFCLQPDISNFIYFPLRRVINQYQLTELQTSVIWSSLRELNLSRNRLTSLEGFELHKKTPNLRVLDLSHNCLDKLTDLMECRGMALTSLKLEGNPLCMDFTDPDMYLRVARMLFPMLKRLDDVPVLRRGDFPELLRNYSPLDARELTDRFLRVFFPLLDTEPQDRMALEEMYDKNALWTLTYHSWMRLDLSYKHCRDLFSRYRNFGNDNTEYIRGASSIARHLTTWPPLVHDPHTFNVDVLHHSDTTTVLTVSGVLKVLTDTLSEDEPLLSFTRTLLLHTDDYSRYRIRNEMLTWHAPSRALCRAAFRSEAIQPNQFLLKLDYPPDEDMKEKLVEIFVKFTNLGKTQSKKFLEIKNWDFKEALEHFVKLLKINSLATMSESDK